MRASHVYRRRLGLAWLFFLMAVAALVVAAVALGLFSEEDRCLDPAARGTPRSSAAKARGPADKHIEHRPSHPHPNPPGQREREE
jgi:hypothetical protein